MSKPVEPPWNDSTKNLVQGVFTRWDSPLAILALLPKNLDLIDYYGVRIVTPLAAAHRIS
ncbi:MAG: hypothetical protein OER77_02320 [Myxococcales bacterium]|nr:hypothetical protein [Myxococcales bacterium]